jgi:hypothetical protein
MSISEKELNILIQKIQSFQIELEELEAKKQKKSFWGKIFSGDVDQSQSKHLKALIKNKNLQLDLAVQKHLKESDPNFKKLAIANQVLLQTDHFELRLLQKHDSILDVVADFNSIREYYKVPSSFFIGNVLTNGQFEFNPVINSSIISGLPQRGMAVEWNGEVDYMGSAHLMLTRTEPVYPRPIMKYPFRYKGSISSEGIIQLNLLEKAVQGTPLIGILVGGPFEKEKQKGLEFLENKSQMGRMRENFKTQLAIKTPG